MRKRPIHDFVCEQLKRVSYVDIDGRSVGYDYQSILDALRVAFPASRTTGRAIAVIAKDLNITQRLPVRIRSRRRLAYGYARSLMVSVATPTPETLMPISETVAQKFPEFTLTWWQLRSLYRDLPIKRGNHAVRV